MCKTKIIASLGPSSANQDIVATLCREGVVGFRINFAHGDETVWRSMVEYVFKAESFIGRPLALIGDLRGPSIRLGDVDEAFFVKKGEVVNLVLRDKGSKERREIPLPIKEVYNKLEVGDTILMNDGKVRFRISDVMHDRIEMTALTDALISSRKAVVIANKEFNLPLLREKDLSDLNFALNNGFNYIGLSYVRRGMDIKIIKDIIRKSGREKVKVIAKVETKSAIENLDEIIEAADAVLVARGDLGMNFGLEEIPYLQKKIISKSLQLGRPVIVATQLLESMVESSVPTRAEVVDVSTAVSDGVDALMLTGETAIGKYPVDAVRWLRKIIETTEDKLSVNRFRDVKALSAKFAKGITELAEDINAKLVVFSVHGNTPRMVALLRPSVDFYVGTPDSEIARYLSILWGLRVYQVDATSYDEGLEATYELLKKKEELRLGELVMLAYGLKEYEQAIKLRRVT
ncbi:MAG: pyruvate kinase [Sulfolobales archaeon]|nr:pyruvate kinase [Sulfolobales archaeon]MCX8186721.1 pyruvate kinase [Sulfolobales archaeon]MDW7969706.1 pyruvate kinase [Sulfolobales archaeon]